MHTETLIDPSAGEDTTAGMPTICAASQATAARYPDRLALRLPGEGIEWSWDEYAARVRRAAHTLHALGVRRGDRVALLLRHRPEHLLADLAAVHLGATPFSMYATSAPSLVAYLVRDSGACVLITEAAFRFEQIKRHTILDAHDASLPHQPRTREDERSRENSVSLRQTAERSHVRRP